MKEIRSTANQTIKERSRLKQKKGRDAAGCFLVEGPHMIEEAAQAGVLQELYVLPAYENAQYGVEPVVCPPQVLEKLSSQNSGAKMIGVCSILPWRLDFSKITRLLVLDRVQDPGNLGTLFRSALAFGFEAIVLGSGCADPYNPKVLQASQGAVFHMPWISTDILELISAQPGFTWYATALHTNSIPLQQTRFTFPCALVLGNEGQGIAPEILKACSESIVIEMATFESLNVAIAGSICMYTIFTQSQKAED